MSSKRPQSAPSKLVPRAKVVDESYLPNDMMKEIMKRSDRKTLVSMRAVSKSTKSMADTIIAHDPYNKYALQRFKKHLEGPYAFFMKLRIRGKLEYEQYKQYIDLHKTDEGHAIDRNVAKEAINKNMDPIKGLNVYTSVLVKHSHNIMNPDASKNCVYILNILMNALKSDARKRYAEDICKKLIEHYLELPNLDPHGDYSIMSLPGIQFLLSYFINHGGRKSFLAYDWRNIQAIDIPTLDDYYEEHDRLHDAMITPENKRTRLLSLLKNGVGDLLIDDRFKNQFDFTYNKWPIQIFKTRAEEPNGRERLPSVKAKSAGGRKKI